MRRLCLSTLAAAALGLQTTVRLTTGERMGQFPGFGGTQFFRQKLDHLSAADERSFDQRYFEKTSYWSAATRPNPAVFLYLGGEAPLYGLPAGFVEELAQEHGAVVVGLEHRYYGKSQPFDTLTTANLRYLSTSQALLDAVSFQHFYSEQLRRRGGNGNGPWYVFGGSYAGALAAWLRAFFSQQFAGAVASSAVVHLELDFRQFDEQVAASCGEQCASLLARTYAAIDALLAEPSENVKVKARFGADSLNDGDFRYLLADSGSMAVQYGFPERLCQPMLQAQSSSGGDLNSVLDAFATYSMVNFYPTLETGSASEYSTGYLQQVASGEEKSARAWFYQTCSELGWFQTSSPRGLRSKNVTLDFFRRHCEDVFGAPLWPNTEAGNRNTGGADIDATNIYFVNGGLDPWQHMSVTSSRGVGIPASVMRCEGCAHCRDLKGSADNDPEAVKTTRADIRHHLANWIALAQPVAVGPNTAVGLMSMI